MQELISQTAEKSKKESLLYREVNAYSPETVGYRFAVAYRDTELESPSIDYLVSNFNTLPTIVVENSHHRNEGTLTILSPHHGRSTELKSVGEQKITVNDSRYRAVSLKGNTLPGDIQFAPIRFDSATGIRIQGVLIGDERMILSYPEKCRRIAEAGLPSERIVVAFKATHVPFAEAGKKETWDIPRAWDEALRTMKVEQIAGDYDLQLAIDFEQEHSWGGETTMNARRSQNLIQSGEIIIFLRAMQVNERIRDLRALTESELTSFCDPAIQFVREQAPEDFQFLPLASDIDELGYLQQWLPKQMGFHLGSWHRKGFVHGYPHAQNWTLAGSLIDNDSAREREQFDLTNESQLLLYQGYQVYDLIRSMESVVEIFDNLRVSRSETGTGNEMKEDVFYAALESFLIEYCKVMFPQFTSLKEKIFALATLLDRELPNPHFDPMRDRAELETIALSKLDSRMANIWARVLKNVSQHY